MFFCSPWQRAYNKSEHAFNLKNKNIYPTNHLWLSSLGPQVNRIRRASLTRLLGNNLQRDSLRERLDLLFIQTEVLFKVTMSPLYWKRLKYSCLAQEVENGIKTSGFRGTVITGATQAYHVSIHGIVSRFGLKALSTKLGESNKTFRGRNRFDRIPQKWNSCTTATVTYT